MISLLLKVLASLLTLVSAPTDGKCPERWWVNGVRPDGRYQCFPAPVGPDERLPSGIVVDHSVQPPGVVDGRVFCTVGKLPVVLDSRTIGCRKGFYTCDT